MSTLGIDLHCTPKHYSGFRKFLDLFLPGLTILSGQLARNCQNKLRDVLSPPVSEEHETFIITQWAALIHKTHMGHSNRERSLPLV